MSNAIPTGAQHLLDEYDADRFWSMVSFHGGTDYVNDPLARITASSGECWIFGERTRADQYGRYRLQGKDQQAHRVAYRDFGLPLSDDEEIDHLCRNKWCIRPSHLEAVTHKVNVQRGELGNKTHCPSGHPMTPDNIRMVSNSRGVYPYCLICIKASRHQTYLRRKAAGKA